MVKYGHLRLTYVTPYKSPGWPQNQMIQCGVGAHANSQRGDHSGFLPLNLGNPGPKATPHSGGVEVKAQSLILARIV